MISRPYHLVMNSRLFQSGHVQVSASLYWLILVPGQMSQLAIRSFGKPKTLPPLLPSQKSEGPRNSAWLMPGLFVHYLCICRFKDTLCVFLACSWHCRLDILTSCAGCCSRSRRSKPVADVSAISKHATCGQDLWDLPSDFSRESDGILVVISQPPGRCWDVHL